VFTLLSWNVLADAHVRAAYYPSTPTALLARGARTGAIVERLLASDADVICLQEAEPSLVEAARARLGRYAIHYLPKGGGKPDGCATFVRGLVVRDVHELAYSDGAPPSGHVALLLEVEHDGVRLGVANTHLKWDPQSRFATVQIAQLVKAMHATVPWIVCGDFNVTPDDAANAAFDKERLVDAYGREPLEAFTAVTNGRARRIDFIRHSVGLSVEALPTPRLDDRAVLPSDEHPSDHIPIAVRVHATTR
jgi:CCR4-NOT transcription complex subunit 6